MMWQVNYITLPFFSDTIKCMAFLSVPYFTNDFQEQPFTYNTHGQLATSVISVSTVRGEVQSVSLSTSLSLCCM